jgi:predicted glutamine amidotransferase
MGTRLLKGLMGTLVNAAALADMATTVVDVEMVHQRRPPAKAGERGSEHSTDFPMVNATRCFNDRVCRWMAYSGEPILIEDLLFKPEHSLIDQSLHARLGVETTNGDGFGIGWYGMGPKPAVFKTVDPAWNERNLREIAAQIRTPLLFAHIRASTGTPVQRSNCHPFRYGHWLWMHNGVLNGFDEIKRDLVMAVDPALYPHIEGSTDSEVLFFLALTLGLTDDPLAAVARAVGLVERVARDRGVVHPVQMTVATTDGESMWVFRYSSEGKTRSLFFSTEVTRLRALHPEVEVLHQLGPQTRFVVSEPLRDLPGAWNEVPESSAGVVRPGGDELRPFRPLEAA